ncbi:hypothetical protein C8035_v001240 [Colletotrichum spinosum]|uniref:Uncharacterized protein n=1 Tax=Colletotrichum spinosum TaxID=1347390 RepID=A0A4R8QG88_9PEZI|nr:hypothetical protein C8035_v001240 [Colletotrichum spinosum]
MASRLVLLPQTASTVQTSQVQAPPSVSTVSTVSTRRRSLPESPSRCLIAVDFDTLPWQSLSPKQLYY